MGRMQGWALKRGALTASVLICLQFAAAPATAAAVSPELTPHEAIYAIRLTHASATTGPRAATGSFESRLTQTCDGWDTKTHIVLNLAFNDGGNVTNERFFSSWESRTGRDYKFAVLTLQDGRTIESYQGTANLNPLGGRASYELPPPEGQSRAEQVRIRLPRGTLFPAAHIKALLTSAEEGKPLLSRVVLDGASSVGPRLKSTAIGPRLAEIPPAGTAELDPALLNTSSWRMSSAYFNLNPKRDLPNTEIFLQLFKSGVTESFDQTFGDFTVSARLERLRHLDRPACPPSRR